MLVTVSLLAPAVAIGGAADLSRALKAARGAVQAGDEKALATALQTVVAEDGRSAARGLLELMVARPEAKPRLYWQIVRALAALEDRGALSVIGDFLVKKGARPEARDILFALQGQGSPRLFDIYCKLLRKGRPELQRMAADRLGELEQVEAVDVLLETLEREDGSGSALERHLRMILTGLFGEDMGVLVNWQGWWQQHREGFFETRRGTGKVTGTVRDELDAARRGGLATMTRGGGKVLVLTGMVRNFDSIEEILSELELPHEAMAKTDFMADMEKALDGTAAVLLNCNFFGSICRCPTCKPEMAPGSRLPRCGGCDKHELRDDKLSDEAVARLKRFVAEGGSVFTEDWGLQELTARAWPEHLRVGDELSEREVDYSPSPGQTASPLLRGVMGPPPDAEGEAGATRTFAADELRWKVDDLSRAIGVAAPDRVTVLLISEALGKSTGGLGAVAVLFSPGATASTSPKPKAGRRRPKTGRGRKGGDSAPQAGIVLHVLSHFGKQLAQRDEMTLQNLLVNFLLEAQARFQASRATD